MTDEEREQLYLQAIEKWGTDLQWMVLVEEMAELTQEVSKGFRRGGMSNDAIQEIADVSIMLEQALLMMGDDAQKEYAECREWKLERLKERLKN
jgi:NTP pyrophosphatase (non-canonical NTP hydrolase)